MGKVKFVTPSGKVIELGEKAMNATSLRQMGFRPYDEVYAPVPSVVVEAIAAPVDIEPGVPAGKYLAEEFTPNLHTSEEATEEKPKRGRPRIKKTMSDADQA